MTRSIWLFLLGLVSLAAAIFRGNAHKAKAEQQEAKADAYEEVIDDVHTAKVVADRINANDAEFERLRDKYSER